MPESSSLTAPAEAAPAQQRQPVRVLLAEDDDPSRHFLESALAAIGCRVHACADGHAALAAARRDRYDVLLLDCRMPGAGAVDILRQLRADPTAASHASAAIASSAELGADLHRQLRAAGFADTLAKPLTLQALHGSVHGVLGHGGTSALLDHQAALCSSGNAQTLAALRDLFLGELQRLRAELPELVQRPADLSARLHPLLASCGFCGATALGEHALRLKQCLDRDADSSQAMHAFRHTLDATLDALMRTQADPYGNLSRVAEDPPGHR